MRIVKLTKETTENILENMLKRSPTQYGTYEASVQEIIENVKTRKDAAVFEYTEKFDHAVLDASTVEVTQEEIDEAYNIVDPELIGVIRRSMKNIREFHEKQKQNSWFTSTENGTMLGQKLTALNRVGVYVPGGKAAYPSSVLMKHSSGKSGRSQRNLHDNAVRQRRKSQPGCPCSSKRSRCGPQSLKSAVQQAIAALAYGTESIPKVDKIVGPGNIYVALAKKAVYGNVSIDSIAGPSEILVLADETANPRFVAADLLSQAEHDELASAILITTSQELAEKVSEEVDGFLKVLSRSDIISKSLDNFGYILVTDSHQEAIDTVDAIAPEHLEIVTKNPFEDMMKVHNAGAIFLGENSSEPLGDYFAGRTISCRRTEPQNSSPRCP